MHLRYLSVLTPIPPVVNSPTQRTYKTPTGPKNYSLTPVMELVLLCVFLSLPSQAVAKLLSSNHQFCRCTSDQDCWPTQSDFQTLASQVSQPLVYPVPPASACYPSSASGNCTDVLQEWGNPLWRANQTDAMENFNWETFTFPNGTIEACYLNVTLGIPCMQGSVPSIGVDARTPGDIQAAVKFASNHNLRLVIKNTG
jgi:hypothetical protein